jgi:flagella basal body P-ring formation protein FlgA
MHMNIFRQFIAVLALTLSAGVPYVAAAEIRLRAECRPQGAVILLGEAAEIFAADEEQTAKLAAVELTPTPIPGSKSFLRLREIQDQLEMRGLNLAEHRFSGASQVAVIGADTTPKAPRRMPATNNKQSQRNVHDAIMKFLAEKASAKEPWDVDVQLDDDQSRQVAAAGRDLEVTSNGPPWTGKHSFNITADSPNGPVRLTVEAQVTLPPAVVVATRTLSKGVAIRPGDVQLQRGRTGATADGIQTLEEVLGLEATRSIAEGQVLDTQSVRQPLLVHKGDVVTVYSRRPGIQVRVTARSRDDGSLGEVVNVESLSDRSTFLARVRNSSEVEVLAMPVTVNGNEFGPPAVVPKAARQTSFTKK